MFGKSQFCIASSIRLMPPCNWSPISLFIKPNVLSTTIYYNFSIEINNKSCTHGHKSGDITPID